MVDRQPRFSPEEFRRRGSEIYERVVRKNLDETVERGRIVAIDIERETFQLGDDELDAGLPLLEQFPDCQLWMVRVGFPVAHRFGGSSVRSSGDDSR